MKIIPQTKIILQKLLSNSKKSSIFAEQKSQETTQIFNCSQIVRKKHGLKSCK
jgi:hypothetical protein